MFIDEEFHRTGPFVANGLGPFDGRSTHALPKFGRNDGRGRFLDELLVTTLDGAVALGKVAYFSVLVADDLDLYVARLFHEFFEVEAVVAKRRPGLGAGVGPGLFKPLFAIDDPHTSATTSGRSLDNNGVAHLGS